MKLSWIETTKRIAANSLEAVMRFALVITIISSGVGLADDRRDNGQMIRLIQPVTKTVGQSVVQILSDGRPVALGTVISNDGYLVTKLSELKGGRIRVRLGDGRLEPARKVAQRRGNDLALLRIESGVSMRPASLANRVPPIASFLISVGRTGRPIGIGVVSVKPRRIEHQGRLGVMLDDDPSGRALVQNVWPKSGADLAGIKPGDLIVAVNGREQHSRMAVIDSLRGLFPGERVQLTIHRPSEKGGVKPMNITARIREFNVLRESESDTKVNGPRNARLSGFDQVIQHDTVLDPDECGGPIVDTQGRVVGINIARAGRVVSYALPSTIVIPAIENMLAEARSAAARKQD